MSKNTYYFHNPHRKLTHLLRDLSNIQMENASKQLKELLSRKKAKLRQMYSLSSHQIIQPSLIPTKHSYSEFIRSTAISKQQKFISEKVKANVLTPDRFYTSQPNVKAGSFILPKKISVEEDRHILQGKLRQFDRIVDDQSGEKKYRKIMKLTSINSQTIQKPNYKFKRMKQTLFQKFMPDKYNFYNNSSLNSSIKKSTNFQSSILKRSQSKYLGSSEGVASAEGKIELLPTSSRQFKTVQLAELNLTKDRKSSILSKSRQKLRLNQKNINSQER